MGKNEESIEYVNDRPGHDRRVWRCTSQGCTTMSILMTTMESAIGAVVIGQHLGWRGLKMVHNPSTYNKYEKLIGVKFKDICPEETKYSKRLLGIAIAKKIGAFWDIVMGRRNIKNKGLVMDEHEAEAIAIKEAAKK